MATPDIGSTISDGYTNGVDTLSRNVASLAVPAIVIGLAAGVVAQLQAEFVPDFEDALSAVMSGDVPTLSFTDRLVVNLAGAAQTVLQLLLMFGAMAVVAGWLHARRGGRDTAFPGPGEVVGAISGRVKELMPKLVILVGLSIVGGVVGIFVPALGGLVSIVAVIALVYFSILWIYAPGVVGTGDATGDAAYERSEGTVRGNWWGTLGVFFVVGLATMIPIGIAGFIVGMFLPGTFLTAFGMWTVIALGYMAIYGAVIESAWHQVGGDATPLDGSSAPARATPVMSEPTPAAPAVPATPSPIDTDDDEPGHTPGAPA